MKLKIALPCLLAASFLLAVPVSSFAGDVKDKIHNARAKIYNHAQCAELCVKKGMCDVPLKVGKCTIIAPSGTPDCQCKKN